MVNVRLLRKISLGDKGDVVNVEEKGASELVKDKVAEYINFDLIPDKETAIKENKKLAKLNKKIKTEKIEEPLEQKKVPENPGEKNIISSNIIGRDPVFNGGDPKWLITREQLIQPYKIKIRDTLEEEQIFDRDVVFEIVDPDKWQCFKCKCIIKSEDKPIFCPKDEGGCDRVSIFHRYTGKINTKRWKLPHWKEIPHEDLDMLLIFDDLKKLLKRCIVFGEDIFYDIFALWIIASYKREAFDSISFLMFLGMIESGKTRGLDLLRELGYQMIHTTGVTFPCMCRYTDIHHAGILIDEIDNKIDKRTEDGRRYLDFLKPSYRIGSIYAVADKEDQDGTKEYSNYGFKAFAGERGGTDYAFLSRCIIFKMEQGYPEIPDLIYVQEELDAMQNILLNYRLQFGNPESLPLEFPLQGRDREIFGCIIQTAKHIGMDSDHIVAFIKERKQEIIEDLQETDEYFILKAIYAVEVTPTLIDAPEILAYSTIAEACGWDQGTDEDKKKRQRIGFILHKKFHLKTKRLGTGTVLLLNNEKNIKTLKNCYQRYKIIN